MPSIAGIAAPFNRFDQGAYIRHAPADRPSQGTAPSDRQPMRKCRRSTVTSAASMGTWPAPATALGAQHLVEFVRRLALQRPEHVAVCAQGDGDGRVAESFLHDARVHACGKQE